MRYFIAMGLETLCRNTALHKSRAIYICAGYDPFLEIKLAAHKASAEGGEFLKYLWVPLSIDLVIRTGGEKRLSNFLCLQSGYAELYFIDKFFLDITTEDIADAFDFYGSKNRRFGR